MHVSEEEMTTIISVLWSRFVMFISRAKKVSHRKSTKARKAGKTQ